MLPQLTYYNLLLHLILLIFTVNFTCSRRLLRLSLALSLLGVNRLGSHALSLRGHHLHHELALAGDVLDLLLLGASGCLLPAVAEPGEQPSLLHFVDCRFELAPHEP